MLKILRFPNASQFNALLVVSQRTQLKGNAVNQFSTKQTNQHGQNAIDVNPVPVKLSYNLYENANETTTASPIIIMHGKFRLCWLCRKHQENINLLCLCNDSAYHLIFYLNLLKNRAVFTKHQFWRAFYMQSTHVKFFLKD